MTWLSSRPATRNLRRCASLRRSPVAVDAQHTGKGSANDVFDFQLKYSDGHTARGEVVAFARQGEHLGNAEVLGVVGSIGYSPGNWDPDADLLEMLTRPAIQKQLHQDRAPTPARGGDAPRYCRCGTNRQRRWPGLRPRRPSWSAGLVR